MNHIHVATTKPTNFDNDRGQVTHMCVSKLYYNDVIMSATASQINSFTIVYASVYSDINQRKHQSSASLAFVRVGIHLWPVNSPHKGPEMRKMFPFDDVIMKQGRVQVMAWLLFGAKPLSEPMLAYCQSNPYKQNSVKFESKHNSIFLASPYNEWYLNEILSSWVARAWGTLPLR